MRIQPVDLIGICAQQTRVPAEVSSRGPDGSLLSTDGYRRPNRTHMTRRLDRHDVPSLREFTAKEGGVPFARR